MNSTYKTYEEYLRHPVFRAARAIAMRRAGGRCRCQAPATEVHHGQGYLHLPWGMFDTPSRLTPICHDCHCRAHNKMNGRKAG